MENYKTFAETEALLKTAIGLPGSSIKDIAAATGIKVSTLYKWNSGNAHLSPTKADKLLLYFMEKEPNRLEMADLVQTTSMYMACFVVLFPEIHFPIRLLCTVLSPFGCDEMNTLCVHINN